MGLDRESQPPDAECMITGTKIRCGQIFRVPEWRPGPGESRGFKEFPSGAEATRSSPPEALSHEGV